MLVDLKNISGALEILKPYMSKLDVKNCDICTGSGNSMYTDVLFWDNLSVLVTQEDGATSIKFFYQSKEINKYNFDSIVEKTHTIKAIRAIDDKFSVEEISISDALEKLMEIELPEKIDVDTRYEVWKECNKMLEYFLSNYPRSFPIVYTRLSGLINDSSIMNLIIKIHNYKNKLKTYLEQ